MKLANGLMLFCLAVGLTVAGCGGKADNEVIVADPDINYAGEYPDEYEAPSYK
ncbi:hypothetical protein [Novipirellula caenicola]|uniref:Lipoprotein n=1 Tax=Novipirellula caenicola TaxID=1536901 RepID=A0ABP9VV41_9BACT